MNQVYSNPSFYSHLLNGILLFIAIVLIYTNYSNIAKLESHNLIGLVILLSIAVGIHGLLHLGLEKVYNYNPIAMIG